MRRLFVPALVSTLAAACSAPTGARLLVLPAPNAQPTALRVRAYGAGLLAAPPAASLVGHPLPGTVVLTNLDPSAHDFRVVVDGLAPAGDIVAEGATRIMLQRGGMAGATVQLSDGKLPDGDGDGVPDVVDDCPGGDDARPICLVARHDLSGVADMIADLSTTSPVDLAASDGPPTRACPAAAFFCEDFEKGFGAAWSAVEDPNSTPSTNTITVDTQHARSGTHAAHVTYHGTQAMNQAQRDRYVTFPQITSGVISVRAWFYWSAAPVEPTYFLHLGQTNFSDNAINLGADSDNAPPTNMSFAAFITTPGYRYTTPFAIAAGQACYEMTYNIDTHSGTLYINDAQARTFTQPTMPPVLFDHLRLGATYVSFESIDLWIDDLAIGTAHLGCN